MPAFAPPTLVAARNGGIQETLEGMPPQIGRFQIRRLLGQGQFGKVYRAYDPQQEGEVALKVAQESVAGNPRLLQRFLSEAKAIVRLHHPHIVPFYEAGSDGNHYFLASAFIEGQTLAAVLEEEPLNFRWAAQIVQALAEALAYAHDEGIVHRDVKPANVMIDQEGQPRLMDFGLAHRNDALTKLTRMGSLVGTPGYMAPEHARGYDGEPQPASDQYSLGVILYVLLCGQTPFSGPPEILRYHTLNTEPPPLRTLNPEIPLELEQICASAMSKRPEDRYPTCHELAAALRNWLVLQTASDVTELAPTPWLELQEAPTTPLQNVGYVPGSAGWAFTANAGTVRTPVHPDFAGAPYRPLWVYLIFGVYLLLIATVLLGPVVILPTMTTIDVDIAVCLVALVALILGVTLLAIRIGNKWEVPTRRRSIVLPLIGTAICAGLLFLGAAMATQEWMSGSAKFGWIILGGTGAVWICWIVFFGWLARSVERGTLNDRLYQCLLAGSLLELLIAIPMHLIVRRRGQCSAGMGTGIGIGVGIIVMLITLGPAVFFLYFRRYKQVYSGRHKRERDSF
jgi:hypothetical protein